MEDTSMLKIFSQRCSTHGCNLLVADVGKLFLSEILLCVRLVKFIANQDGNYAIMHQISGSLHLCAAVEIWFCSQIYSSEAILKDKLFIRELCSGAVSREYMVRASEELKNEYRSLDMDLVSNPAAWARILRISDGHQANLTHMRYGYEEARKQALAAANTAILQYP